MRWVVAVYLLVAAATVVEISIQDWIVSFVANIAITMHECANKGVSSNLWIANSNKKIKFYEFPTILRA